MGLLGGSAVKIHVECRRGRFNPWVRKIPWRRKWQLTPVFLPRKSHGDREAWWATVHGVTKELDTTLPLNNNNQYIGNREAFKEEITFKSKCRGKIELSQVKQVYFQHMQHLTHFIHYTYTQQTKLKVTSLRERKFFPLSAKNLRQTL